MRGLPRVLSVPAVLTGRRLVLAIAAVVATVAAAGGTAIALTTSAPSHAVSMSRGDLTRAALKVTAGTPFLDVSMGRLGGTLLRVSTPDGAPVRPVLSGSNLIVLSLAGASGSGGSGNSGYVVRVVLNSAVTWALDLASGTERTVVDLRGGKVAGMAVTAGSAALDVSLPRPSGTLPFLLAGGVSQFRLSLPGGVPVQVTVGGGASSVSVDDQKLTGIAGGTVLTPPGWTSATSRFDIDAVSGFSQLTVSRRST
ncbi:MAG TPA: hypothetical protein VNH17_20570, partial [Streptosporangiaceae bacterium]|nr:hypothetical protein [Streptosporangiaceae bacterium]